MSMGDVTNVIFILSDDQGPWAMGCAGNDEIRTPNLDRLAATGMRFENLFCVSPVCSPARASLLTGQIPSQHGVHDWIREGNTGEDAAAYLDGLSCYTDVLAAHGYTCGLVGKWHLGDSQRPQHGFSSWYTIPKGGGPYRDAPVIRGGEVLESEGYLSDRFGDEAVAFVEANRDRPFYLSLHFTAPHTPYTGHPEEIVDSYDDCPFASCPQGHSHPWLNPVWESHVGNRESLKGYFAAVTAMDLNIGRVIDKVEELGLREQTLIVFTSDNGFSCGQRGLWGKGNGTVPLNLYENSVKVPGLFSHPGRVPEGVVSEALVSHYDWLPTLLAYLGLPALEDASLPGESFLPVLLGEAAEAREEVVVYDEYGPARMIRTRQWKYIHRYPYGPHELYDLVHDPEEHRNLVGVAEQAERVAAMRRRLSTWFGDYVSPELDGARFPVSGGGQRAPVGRDRPGEEVFFTDRQVERLPSPASPDFP